MTVNISNIKTQFKTIMDAWNSTGATYDLSAGLTQRVRKVLKVNPLKIPVQASNFPYVTIYIADKDIAQDGIARDQLTARRMGEIGLNIVGGVFETNSLTPETDPADEQIEILMENVEEVLRRNFELNGAVQWTKPVKVSYHTYPVNQQTHLRVGLFEVIAKVNY
jgi:hypothetical protein